MSILASARKVVDSYVIDAPRKLEIRDADFVEDFVLPAGPIVGQAADFATTVYALRRGAEEANPIMKGVVRSLPVFAAVKLALGVGAAVMVKRTESKTAKRVFSGIATMAGLGPALSNIAQTRLR